MRIAAWAGLVLLAGSCSSTPPVTSCPEGQTVCGNACVDQKLDNQHCGACLNACGIESACAGGNCLPKACADRTCAAGHVCVDGICADRTCFAVICPEGNACAAGLCLPTSCSSQTCAPGTVCVDDACQDASCVGVICPAGLACARGTCVADSCGDGIKSGTESDTDCGGDLCPGCNSGQICASASDCDNRVCTLGRCAIPSCSDRVRNGQEGDVDCGGPCPLCDPGKTCTSAAQCATGACTQGRCAAAQCGDGVKNGAETDRDCGGNCPPCSDGFDCEKASDCQSTYCVTKTCVSAACVNGVKDGTESDVDCGATCAGCADGRICATAADCASKVCGAAMRCVVPNCSDAVKNGLEVDTDCGGPCGPCGVGKKCNLPTDCLSRSCQNGTCFAPSCSDAILNGLEIDLDCGGDGGCTRCGAGKLCGVPTDCASSSCQAGRCDPPPYFVPPVLIPSGSTPRGLTINDVDNDGLNDLVTGNHDSFDVSVIYQQTDGGLAPPLNMQVTTNPNIRGPVSVSVGDLNGDGFKDLVVPRNSVFAGSNYQAWGGCRISILRGVGSRQFLGAVDSEWIPERSGCGWQSELVRLSPDALLDLVVSDSLDGISGAGMPRSTEADLFGGWSFLQAGDGGFAVPGGTLDAAGPSIFVGDINNDGAADVVGHSNRQGQVRTYLGTGTGGFQPARVFGVSPGWGDVLLADFDTDGKLDLAVATESSGTIGVAKGLGTGDFIAPVAYPVPTPWGLAAADVDRDGKLDLIVGTTGIAVLLGNGDGTFKPAVTYFPGLGRISVMKAGDLNGDGKTDLAVLGQSAVRVLINATP